MTSGLAALLDSFTHANETRATIQIHELHLNYPKNPFCIILIVDFLATHPPQVAP